METTTQKHTEHLIQQLRLSPRAHDENNSLRAITKQIYEKNAFWLATVALMFVALCLAVIAVHSLGENKGWWDPNLVMELPDRRWGNQYNAAALTTMAMDDRYVWVGTNGNGLHVYDKATQIWRTFRAQAALPSDRISLVKFDGSNPDFLWALTHGGGLGLAQNHAGDHWKTVFGTTPFSALNDTLTSAARNGPLIVVGTQNHGVGIYDLRSRKWVAHLTQATDGRFPADQINVVRAGADENSFWVGTPRGLARLEKNEVAKTFLAGSIYNNVTGLEVRPQEVWYLTQGNVSLGRVRDNTDHDMLLQTNPLPVRPHEFTAAAQAGNWLWVGTRQDGLLLYELDLHRWHNWRRGATKSLPSNSITALAVHPKTNELFIGSDSGLTILSEKQAANPGPNQAWMNFSLGKIRQIRFEENDAYWLTASGKLGLRRGRSEEVEILADSSATWCDAGDITAAAQSNQFLYIGTRRGLVSRYDLRSHTWSDLWPVLPDSINQLAFNPFTGATLVLTPRMAHLAHDTSSGFISSASVQGLATQSLRIAPTSTGFILLDANSRLTRLNETMNAVTMLGGNRAPFASFNPISIDQAGARIYFVTADKRVLTYDTRDHDWSLPPELPSGVEQIRNAAGTLIYQDQSGALRTAGGNTLIGGRALALSDTLIRNAVEAQGNLYVATDQFIEKYDKNTHAWLPNQRVRLQGNGSITHLFAPAGKLAYRTSHGELWVDGRRLDDNIDEVAGIDNALWYVKNGSLYRAFALYNGNIEGPARFINSQGLPKLANEQMVSAAEFADKIWIATDQRLLIYNKTSRAWSRRNLPEGRAITQLRANASFLYAAANGMLYRSGYYDSTWTRISPPQNPMRDWAVATSGAMILHMDGTISRPSYYGDPWRISPNDAPVPLDLSRLVYAQDDSANLCVVTPQHLLHYDKYRHTWDRTYEISSNQAQVKQAEIHGQRVWVYGTDGSVQLGSLQGSFTPFLPGHADRANIDLSQAVDAVEVQNQIFVATPHRVQVYDRSLHSWRSALDLGQDTFDNFLVRDAAVMLVTRSGALYEYERSNHNSQAFVARGTLPVQQPLQIALDDKRKLWALDRSGAVLRFTIRAQGYFSVDTLIHSNTGIMDLSKVADARLHEKHLLILEDNRILIYHRESRKWQRPLQCSATIREFLVAGKFLWVRLENGEVLRARLTERGFGSLLTKAAAALDLEKSGESWREQIAVLKTDSLGVWEANSPEAKTKWQKTNGPIKRLLQSNRELLLALDAQGKLFRIDSRSKKPEPVTGFQPVPINVQAVSLSADFRRLWYVHAGQAFYAYAHSGQIERYALQKFQRPYQHLRLELGGYLDEQLQIVTDAGESCRLETRLGWRVAPWGLLPMPYRTMTAEFVLSRLPMPKSGRGLLEDYGYEAATGKFRSDAVRSLEVHGGYLNLWLATEAGIYRCDAGASHFSLPATHEATSRELGGKLQRNLANGRRVFLYEKPGRALMWVDSSASWNEVKADQPRVLIDTPLWRWTLRAGRIEIAVKNAKLNPNQQPIYNPNTGKFFFDEIQGFAASDEGLWIQTQAGPCFYPIANPTEPDFQQKPPEAIRKRLAGQRDSVWVDTPVWRWGTSQGRSYVRLKTQNANEIPLPASLTRFPFDQIHSIAHDGANLWMATSIGMVRLLENNFDKLKIYRLPAAPVEAQYARFPDKQFRLVCRTGSGNLQFDAGNNSWSPLQGSFNPFVTTLCIDDELWQWRATAGSVTAQFNHPAVKNLDPFDRSNDTWRFRFDRVKAMTNSGAELFMAGDSLVCQYRSPDGGMPLSAMEILPGPALSSADRAKIVALYQGASPALSIYVERTGSRIYRIWRDANTNTPRLAPYNGSSNPFARRTLIDNGFWRWTLDLANGQVSKSLLSPGGRPIDLRMTNGRFAFDDVQSFAVGGGQIWLATSGGVARYPLSGYNLSLSELRFEANIAGQQNPWITAINVQGDSMAYCEIAGARTFRRRLTEQNWTTASPRANAWQRQPIASTFWTWTEDVKSRSVSGAYRDVRGRTHPVRMINGQFVFDAISDVAWNNQTLWLATAAGVCAYPGNSFALDLDSLQVYSELSGVSRLMNVPPDKPAPAGLYAAAGGKISRFAGKQWQPFTSQRAAGYSDAEYLRDRAAYETLVDYDGFWRCRRRTSAEAPGTPPVIWETRASGNWQKVSFQKGRFDFDDIRGLALDNAKLWLATRAGICRYDRAPDGLDLKHMQPWWGAQWEDATDVLVRRGDRKSELVIRRGRNNATVASIALNDGAAQLQPVPAGDNPFARQTLVRSDYWHWLDQEQLKGNVSVGPRLGLELREASGAWMPVDLDSNAAYLPWDEVASFAHYDKALWLATPLGVFSYPDDQSLALAHATFYSAQNNLADAKQLLVDRNGTLFCETGSGSARRLFYYIAAKNEWAEAASQAGLERFRFREDQWHWHEQNGRVQIRFQNDPSRRRPFHRGYFADHFILSATIDNHALWCLTPAGIFRYAGTPGRDSLQTVAWIKDEDLVGVPKTLAASARYSILREQESLWLLTAAGILRFRLDGRSEQLVFVKAYSLPLNGAAILGGQLSRDGFGKLIASLSLSANGAQTRATFWLDPAGLWVQENAITSGAAGYRKLFGAIYFLEGDSGRIILSRQQRNGPNQRLAEGYILPAAQQQALLVEGNLYTLGNDTINCYRLDLDGERFAIKWRQALPKAVSMTLQNGTILCRTADGKSHQISARGKLSGSEQAAAAIDVLYEDQNWRWHRQDRSLYVELVHPNAPVRRIAIARLAAETSGLAFDQPQNRLVILTASGTPLTFEPGSAGFVEPSSFAGAVPGSSSYLVKEGDTLYEIVRRLLGPNASRNEIEACAKKICATNRHLIKDCDQILPGWTLQVSCAATQIPVIANSEWAGKKGVWIKNSSGQTTPLVLGRSGAVSLALAAEDSSFAYLAVPEAIFQMEKRSGQLNRIFAAAHHFYGKVKHLVSRNGKVHGMDTQGKAWRLENDSWQSPFIILSPSRAVENERSAVSMLAWEAKSGNLVFHSQHPGLAAKFRGAIAPFQARALITLEEDADRVWIATSQGIVAVNKKTAYRMGSR